MLAYLPHSPREFVALFVEGLRFLGVINVQPVGLPPRRTTANA